jgi:hypothetical protein
MSPHEQRTTAFMTVAFPESTRPVGTGAGDRSGDIPASIGPGSAKPFLARVVFDIGDRCAGEFAIQSRAIRNASPEELWPRRNGHLGIDPFRE